MATNLRLHAIAAGNNNAGGLTLVTALQDANGVNFTHVRGLPTRRRGVRRVRLDETTALIGSDTVEWISSGMTLAQYSYILSTFGIESANKGLVTITHDLTSTTFANYNAILTMPDEADLEFVTNLRHPLISGFNGPAYQNVVWSFRKLEAL